MEIVNLIKTRRSVRSFTGEPVADDTLKLLVEAACWAPTGSNMQAWEFVVIRDREKIKKLKSFSPGLFASPPALIVVCIDRERALARGGEMGRDIVSLFDAAMAVQNILLLAHSMALGACVLRSFDQKAFQILLELPASVMPEMLVTVGVPKVVPQAPPRRPLEEVLHFERWDG
ncbi:MAG: nitroreductase family protein [Bacillota bacterium]